MSCVLLVPSSAARTHFYFPLFASIKTWSGWPVPCRNMSVQTRPHACCPQGRRGSSSLPSVHADKAAATANPARPTELVWALVGSDSRRRVCVYIRSIWTTCNWTLLVFLHNSIPLEPHNILLIAHGLATYFASKAAATDSLSMLMFQTPTRSPSGSWFLEEHCCILQSLVLTQQRTLQTQKLVVLFYIKYSTFR